MKQLLCFWSLLLLGISVTGQNVLITDAPLLKKGLYKTFEEFQSNNPSEEGDLVIKNRSSAAQIYLLANRNELVLRDGAGQEHKLKNYWGFCDGKNIYIKDNGLNKLQEIGYYCIYALHGIQPSRGYINQADMTTNSINTPVVLKKVLNVVTGQILELSAYNLKKYILPQDSVLLDEFRADREKKDQLEYYIFRFNQRNKPEIK
ncbi:hypothetical protein [Chitinophaga ginsengisegetis]|uniref:hypothetical protein n=1 Tax=Chitinophaga ginsengisegetis TaxID=393003 RepID=UPI000DBA5AD8|nr:hypothetical protein [Chitinophaga ginsengisegetis]MDR6566188.1 hypothetical protein [Chitinophaga ginsengisegetis]MDR6645918.1 hypothetical protein [Chitinophaga ginsengisegetis]MDR6651490.1 hypothetical protein [Chitinophaga ginsengisegetis]